MTEAEVDVMYFEGGGRGCKSPLEAEAGVEGRDTDIRKHFLQEPPKVIQYYFHFHSSPIRLTSYL